VCHNGVFAIFLPWGEFLFKEILIWVHPEKEYLCGEGG
jgi:hypothetical protein